MEHGDAARARLLLEQAVEASPSDVDARRQLAEVLWHDGAAAGGGRAHRGGRDVSIRGTRRRSCAPAKCCWASAVRRSGAGAGRAGAGARRDAGRTRGPCAAACSANGASRIGRWPIMHQALRYNPHSADVLLEAAELQYQLGRPQRCLTTLQNLLELYPAGEEPRQRAVARRVGLRGRGSAGRTRSTALYAASTRGRAGARAALPTGPRAKRGRTTRPRRRRRPGRRPTRATRAAARCSPSSRREARGRRHDPALAAAGSIARRDSVRPSHRQNRHRRQLRQIGRHAPRCRRYSR